MSDITNPQIVKEDNEVVRPTVQAVVLAFEKLEHYMLTWGAQGMDALVTDTTDMIADGSATDGRPRLTEHQMRRVTAAFGRLMALANTVQEDGLTDIQALAAIVSMD